MMTDNIRLKKLSGKHIFNGDALKDQLAAVEMDYLVMRECLIEGPLRGNNLSDLLNNRIDYFENTLEVPASEYRDKSINEITKIRDFPNGTIVHLWFERDLFCQSNMWFLINGLSQLNKNFEIYLVSPAHSDWRGFGIMNADELLLAFQNKQKISAEAIMLFSKLWVAYQKSIWADMRKISRSLKYLGYDLDKVIEAYIARFPAQGKPGRPEIRLAEIINKDPSMNFGNIFKEFWATEGIYGFGDLQVRKLLETIRAKRG